MNAFPVAPWLAVDAYLQTGSFPITYSTSIAGAAWP